MPLAGLLCESRWGWSAIYYLQGALSALLFTLFYAFFRDSPRQQRYVSAKELARIEAGKASVVLAKGEALEVPYRAMLTDVVVWAILLCNFSGTGGFMIFFQYAPVYLHKVLLFIKKLLGRRKWGSTVINYRLCSQAQDGN